jgi:helicase MOV-10
MFYDNELIPCASIETSEKLSDISWLPKKGVPLVFHGVRGENFQETDSPSWFNPAEVYHVARYLQKLLNHGVNADDIGIITPYRKQVDKIRQYIKANELIPAKVASVEEFQGQEREVIIVSTTRSNGSLINDDILHHLGFIRSPKRFNVTITRAKALLIVIGNPHLLIHDDHWGPFLQYSVSMGAYTGCDLPVLPNA